MIDKFYEKNNFPDFPYATYRKGAEKTTDFGLDNTFKDLRIHPAIDRAAGDVYVPFTVAKSCYTPWYNTSFGTILCLRFKDTDFMMRIMHMMPEDMPLHVLRNLSIQGNFERGSRLGVAGEGGKSAGRHTHTEIVSRNGSSKICEDIIRRKAPHRLFQEYTEDEIIKYGKEHNIDQVLHKYYDLRMKKSITFLNDWKCQRTDYMTGQIKTFYNSWALFNGV